MAWHQPCSTRCRQQPPHPMTAAQTGQQHHDKTSDTQGWSNAASATRPLPTPGALAVTHSRHGPPLTASASPTTCRSQCSADATDTRTCLAQEARVAIDHADTPCVGALAMVCCVCLRPTCRCGTHCGLLGHQQGTSEDDVQGSRAADGVAAAAAAAAMTRGR